MELEPIPFADVAPSDPRLIHPIAEAIAKKWKVKVLGFDWTAAVVVPKLKNNGYGWGLFSEKEGALSTDGYDFDWNCSSGACSSEITGVGVSASAFLYDQDGVRNSAVFPAELKAKSSLTLPFNMTINCLSGYECSWNGSAFGKIIYANVKESI